MPIPIDPKVILDIKIKIQSKLAYASKAYKYYEAIPWDKAYIAGGAIASMIQGEEPKDYDVYFIEEPIFNIMQTVRTVLITTYKDEIEDVQEHYREYMGTDGKMITENAITMKDGISFIFKSYGAPEDMKKSFDYLHCTPHYHITENKLYISPTAYWACVAKLLIINNPFKIEQWRTDKFLKRGYREHKISSF